MKSQLITGIIAGNFDVIHPGYIDMFAQCKEQCSCLIVLLHEDPSEERPEKCKPILSVKERIEILSSLRQIDDVATYTLESELHAILSDMHEINKRFGNRIIRFLGDDYRNKPFTGDDLDIEIYYLNRDHGWSTTKFKTMIANSINTITNEKND